MSYAKMFYWAGYYGDKQICQYFMKYLGISPFIKLFMMQDVVAACVKGGQYDLLSYFIKDTNHHEESNLFD